ncbi:MAG: M28 family peptidase [Gemmatimonadota bacterium]
MRSHITLSTRTTLLVTFIGAIGAVPLTAQGPGGGAPWFGLSLPSGLGNPHVPVVAIPADLPLPAPLVPAAEEARPELAGVRIVADVETITGFSRASRAVGNRLWGRIAGFPSLTDTMEWVAEQFRAAGLRDVQVQTFEASAGMWWPREWEVSLSGDGRFGDGTVDLVLESAFPTGGSEIPDGAISAPLVFAGAITEAVILSGDVLRGRIAVQSVRPAGGVYSERGGTVERARALFEAGAVAVLNVVEQTGNMHVRDFGNCGGPCFNLGTADGAFLIAAIEEAARRGIEPGIAATLSLSAQTLEGLTAENAVGILEGESDEVVIVNAHADGWFDGAGDNGDGLAVLLALARHFASQDARPPRTLIFVASAGHHGSGLNGPSNFVRMNPEIGERAVLALNLEHVSQLEIRPGDWRVEATEQPMGFGISNEAPFIADTALRGMERTGFNLRPTFGSGVPGDLGGYAPLGVPRVQAIHSGPMYHTSGDVLGTISVPGLERAARFFAFFIEELANAPRAALDP